MNRPACLGVVVILFIAAACMDSQPIVIGFSGQLTGLRSDLGVQGRNGATLAVEEINASGGVAGRTLRLTAEDDEDTPEGAVKAVRAIKAAGAVAVIGNMTSSQSVAALPEAEKAGLVMVSPTTATPELSGKADGFFRVIPVNRDWALSLARHARRNMKLSNVFIVADSDNASYVDTFNAAFREAFFASGGAVAGEYRFSSKAKADWPGTLDQAAKAGADAILATAAARDVADLATAMHLSPHHFEIICPAWPYTNEILAAGGAQVEGIVFATSYTEENDWPPFADFRERFRKRFGWQPNFAAAFAYESVLVLAEGLKATGGSARGLAQALGKIGRIQGVIGEFTLDANGDVRRETFITTITGGRFATVRKAGE